jgi:hypothetical protein
MERIRNGILWDESEDKKKYHLVNWQIVCPLKDQGALGILALEVMNTALLSKWL